MKNFNEVTDGLSGRWAKLVFSLRHAKTIVGRAPRHSKAVTTAQNQIRVSFKEAAIYALLAIIQLVSF